MSAEHEVIEIMRSTIHILKQQLAAKEAELSALRWERNRLVYFVARIADSMIAISDTDIEATELLSQLGYKVDQQGFFHKQAAELLGKEGKDGE